MVLSSLIPTWFMGYGVILETLILVVTIFVALYSYQIYKITKMRNIKSLSVAFMLFSLSFVVLMIMNLLFMLEYNFELFTLFGSMCPMLALYPGIVMHMIIYMIGLVTLVYAIVGGEDRKIYYLFGIVTTIAILAARNAIIMFNLISVIILATLAIFALAKFFKNKHRLNLMFVLFILLLFLGKLPFLISTNHESCTVFDHVSLFIAHLLLFAVLLMVMKNGVKKRQARSNS